MTSNLTPEGEARDKAALYEYNFKTKTFGKLVYEHPEIDCCGLIMNEKKRDMIGVAYMVGLPERVYLDERWKTIMAAIDQALPDTVNTITSVDDDETIGVVVAQNSRQPAKYYLFDFREQHDGVAGRFPAVARPAADGRDEAHRVRVPRRYENARLPDRAQRQRRQESAAGGQSARRSLGPRWLGLQRRNPVSGEPRLRRAAGQLPRLRRVWHGAPDVQLEAVGPGHAE